MAEQFEKYIGKYGVLALIGEGGMGHIYKAVDPRIRRTVAIKTVRTAGIHDAKLQEFKERFFREAEISGRLHHPYIVTLYEMDEDPKTGDLFIAMEFVDGSPLSAYTQSRTEMDIKLKIKLLTQAAAGLDHAHHQGVVHRDVKPSNILISRKGEAKITDFGIAKVAESDLPQVTRTDTFLGSPRYSSPEQVRGSGVDSRSDIFSFGILSYEFLVGVNPFAGSNLSESLYKIAQCLPNLDHQNDYINYPSPDLRSIFQKVLHAQQSQRYQSLTSFVKDLESVIIDGKAHAHLGQSESMKSAIRDLSTAETTKMPVVDASGYTGGSSGTASLSTGDLEDPTVVDPDFDQPPERRAKSAQEADEKKKSNKNLPLFAGSAAAVIFLAILVGYFLSGGDASELEAQPEPATAANLEEVPAETASEIDAFEDEALPQDAAAEIETRPPLDLGARTPFEEIALKRDRFLYHLNLGDLEDAQSVLDEMANSGIQVNAEAALIADVRDQLAVEAERTELLGKYERGKRSENLAAMNAALRSYRKLFPEERVLPDQWQLEIRQLEDQFRPKPRNRNTTESVAKSEPNKPKVINPDQGFLDRIDTPMRQGRFDLAEQTLQAGLDVFANHPEIEWRAGFLAFQKRNFNEATNYFKPLLNSENETASTIAREYLANQAFLEGNFTEAKRLYDALSSNLLTMTERHRKELEGLLAQNHLKDGKLFELVWRDHGVDPASMDGSRWSNRRKAGDIADVVEQQKDWLMSGALLVDFYRLNSQERKAVKLLEQLKSRFESHYYYQETAAAFHYRTGEFQRAVTAFGEVVYPSPRLKYLLGLCYFKLGDKVKARQLLLELNADDYPDVVELRQSL